MSTVKGKTVWIKYVKTLMKREWGIFEQYGDWVLKTEVATTFFENGANFSETRRNSSTVTIYNFMLNWLTLVGGEKKDVLQWDARFGQFQICECQMFGSVTVYSHWSSKRLSRETPNIFTLNKQEYISQHTKTEGNKTPVSWCLVCSRIWKMGKL